MSQQHPARTLSRSDVAARLQISVSSVRRLEFDKLNPMQDEHGVWRFDPAEVDAVASTNVRRRRRSPRRKGEEIDARVRAKDGRIAATVFRLFAKRMSLPQIVVATKTSPFVIRELYREWSTTLDDGEWERRSKLSEP